MKQKDAFKSTTNWLRDFWVYCIRPFVIIAATLLILYFGASKVVSYVANHYFLPPQPDNAEEFTLEIPSGYGVRGISKILKENDVISNSFVFKLFVDVSNNSYKLQSGRYIFRHNMTMQEVMDQLLIGNNTVPTTTITIPEGWSIGRIATYLVNTKKMQGFTEQEFIDYAVPSNFENYWFLESINEDRLEYGYGLQGYLFPDTYEVYIDSTPKEIIKKMLDNFAVRIPDTLVKEAEEKGYTIDEVITLASIVEKEAANVKEYYRVSAVIENRLKTDMALQMESTVVYMLALLGESRASSYDITSADLQMDNPYNTYIKKGIPIGPICNPGLAAIKAVLSPNQEDIDNKTLYFVLDPETGTNTFNSDFSKHVEASRLYEKKYKEMHAND